MTQDMDSVSGSPVSSVMSVSSASTPGTPGSGHFQFSSSSVASVGCDMSDSMDSDMENNNVLVNLKNGQSVFNATVKIEPVDTENNQTTPKKKRYSKSRVRNRSPALVKKLKLTRRSKANDRERHRMHNLNDALDSLRKILPNHGEENKLTKIETLRFAYNYIFALREMLNMLDRGEAIDGDELLSAQLSAAATMKLDGQSASQTLSQLHQQQIQRQQQHHNHHQQQAMFQTSPQMMSPVSHQGPVSPAVSTHPQQLSPSLPHVPSSMERTDVIGRRCQDSKSITATGTTTCYPVDTNQVDLVQVHNNFVSHSSVVSQQNFNHYVMTSSSMSPTNHVTGYSLCPPHFHWAGSMQNSHGYQFEHPHSPAGYSDTSDGYTFEMM